MDLRGRMRAVASEVAEAAAVEACTIPEEELIQMTKDWVGTFNGLTDEQTSKLSDDFVYRGPVVGPLCRDKYVHALNGFKIEQAFPDIETKAFGFSIDPQDPFRVWFFTQTTGTHTQPMGTAGSLPPTGQPIRNGVEAASVIWTPDRKIKYSSGGYCADRINSNTPNGTMKVAVVGILRAAGANCKFIWALFTNPVVAFFMNLVLRLRGVPKEAHVGPSAWEDLPQWWKDLPDGRLAGAQGYNR